MCRWTTWCSSVSSCRQASMSAWTPVMSSSCDSLKSVVMRGCVSAEPSPGGCGVSASVPSAWTRRPSFSRPRRRPRRQFRAEFLQTMFETGQAESSWVAPAMGGVSIRRGQRSRLLLRIVA